MLPGYTALIADTRTGTVYDDLPISDFTWSDSVDWARPGSMTLTCPLTGGQGVSEWELKTKTRSVASSPWKTTLILVRGSTALFAGPVVTYAGGEDVVQFGCASIQKILDARLVIATGYATNPTAAAADVSFAVNPPAVAAGLLQLAITGAGRNLPLVIPTVAATADGTRVYPSVDLAPVGDRLKALTEETSGPDLRIRPSLDLQQTQLTWNVDIGTPQLGDRTAPWVWDYPVAITSLSVDADASSMTSTGYTVGDGTDRNRILGIATDPTSVNAGFPALERTSRDNASNKSFVQVQSLATGFVTANQAPAITWRVAVDPEQFPEIGVWQFGDNAKLTLSGHPWLDDGDYVRRLIGVTHTPGMAALETTVALPGPT